MNEFKLLKRKCNRDVKEILKKNKKVSWHTKKTIHLVEIDAQERKMCVADDMSKAFGDAQIIKEDVRQANRLGVDYAMYDSAIFPKM